MTSVAARATIEVIEEENLLENAHVVGGYFRAQARRTAAEIPLIGDVRGMGLMQALELVKDRADQGARARSDNQLLERAREQRPADRQGRPLRQRDPPLAHAEHRQIRRRRSHSPPRQIFLRDPHLMFTANRVILSGEAALHSSARSGGRAASESRNPSSSPTLEASLPLTAARPSL